jgi:DNA-binding Lrp family transcriptional regulator
MSSLAKLDKLDRKIINALQGGFPINDAPFQEVAHWLEVGEYDIIRKIGQMLEQGTLTRFGPLYNPERIGGAVTLAALAVPQERYDEVTEMVNANVEVAHNYARDNALNMWFVIATEKPEQIDAVIGKIEKDTGLEVFNFPKKKEFFIGLRLEV